jgi:hypothetical protein
MPDDSLLADLDAELDAAVKSLESKRAEFEGALEDLDARRLELREGIRRIDAMLRGRNPKKPGPSKGTPKNQSRIAAATLDTLAEWLRTNYNGNEFTAPEAWADVPRMDGIGTTYRMGIAIKELHERGVLRLVRTGGGKTGRAKVWKVAST